VEKAEEITVRVLVGKIEMENGDAKLKFVKFFPKNDYLVNILLPPVFYELEKPLSDGITGFYEGIWSFEEGFRNSPMGFVENVLFGLEMENKGNLNLFEK